MSRTPSIANTVRDMVMVGSSMYPTKLAALANGGILSY